MISMSLGDTIDKRCETLERRVEQRLNEAEKRLERISEAVGLRELKSTVGDDDMDRKRLKASHRCLLCNEILSRICCSRQFEILYFSTPTAVNTLYPFLCLRRCLLTEHSLTRPHFPMLSFVFTLHIFIVTI
jgi:hypothetical protein